MIHVLGHNQWGTYFSSGSRNWDDVSCKGMIVLLLCGHLLDRKAGFPEQCKECLK